MWQISNFNTNWSTVKEQGATWLQGTCSCDDDVSQAGQLLQPFLWCASVSDGHRRITWEEIRLLPHLHNSWEEAVKNPLLKNTFNSQYLPWTASFENVTLLNKYVFCTPLRTEVDRSHHQFYKFGEKVANICSSWDTNKMTFTSALMVVISE